MTAAEYAIYKLNAKIRALKKQGSTSEAIDALIEVRDAYASEMMVDPEYAGSPETAKYDLETEARR